MYLTEHSSMEDVVSPPTEMAGFNTLECYMSSSYADIFYLEACGFLASFQVAKYF